MSLARQPAAAQSIGQSEPRDGVVPSVVPAPFSVVLPVYNEERALLPTIEALRRVLEGTGRRYEIIIVDDGSAEGTRRIIESCDGVRVVRHAVNRGYGAAL